jgi:hypothetical protein
MTVEQDVAAGAKRARDEEAPADGAAAEEGEQAPQRCYYCVDARFQQ